MRACTHAPAHAHMHTRILHMRVRVCVLRARRRADPCLPAGTGPGHAQRWILQNVHADGRGSLCAQRSPLAPAALRHRRRGAHRATPSPTPRASACVRAARCVLRARIHPRTPLQLPPRQGGTPPNVQRPRSRRRGVPAQALATAPEASTLLPPLRRLYCRVTQPTNLQAKTFSRPNFIFNSCRTQSRAVRFWVADLSAMDVVVAVEDEYFFDWFYQKVSPGMVAAAPPLTPSARPPALGASVSCAAPVQRRARTARDPCCDAARAGCRERRTGTRL